ncbi:MAG: DUF2851 family protein [Bacteroidota bacterium]
MREEFLYYIWKFQLLKSKLQTEDGQHVEVIKPGFLNPDSGPDFIQAMIRVGETLWAGSVEIHTRSSDWFRHGHQQDPAYLGVIMHVVFESDKPVFRTENEILPTLVLKDRFDPGLYMRYENFLSSQQWIPCSGQLHHVPSSHLKTYLSALAVERYEDRLLLIDNLLHANHGDFEETTHQFFARSFGMVINTDPFERLARILPFSLCRRYKDQDIILEALALGQAGFLRPDFDDDYAKSLWSEYHHLKHKHHLTSMSADDWKFLRIRPSGFPTMRIVNWAAFLKERHSLVDEVLLEMNLENVMEYLNRKLHSYWDSHFIPGRPARKNSSNPGEGFIRVWIINALVPMLIFYGKRKERQDRIDMALNIMESLPAEDNKILRAWADIGVTATNALEGQGLIYLKKCYCDLKKCLNCSIGIRILSQGKD